MPVRVVHYGDSQTEEDRITNVLRERWQKQYGGGGPGLLPLHQTVPTRTIRQWISINGVVQTAQGGPKRYIVYGPKSMRLTDSDEYGVMGQVAVMDSTLVAGSENIVMTIEPLDKKRKPHNYFNRIRVLTDSMDGYILAKDSVYYLGERYMQILPDSCERCEIHLQGRGKVYGVSLETPTGVIVDNIPMRGCSGNIFTKIDSTQLSDFYSETNTRLIILQFGGNMIPQTENPSTINGYVRGTLRQQVRYLRACAPQAAILFIGPSDMSTRIDGEMVTYPLVPYMDRLLKKMAEEEQIAYWSMYDAMGGEDSMVRWVENGLAGSDYVHFTRSGANKVGRLLHEWLMSYQPDSLNTKL
jgi:lysophospholipase L1-like esterase